MTTQPKRKFKIGQIIQDNKGARWIVRGYVLNLVSVRPQSEDAYKQYGGYLMSEWLLSKVKGKVMQ